MKRISTVGTLIACMFLLAGCAGSSSSEKIGTVVVCGGEPLMFELACEGGNNYGFVIDDSTELIWEDTSAFSLWKDKTFPYDGWDVFDCGMYVTVVPGDETESADESVNECVEGWYMAEKITVTGVDDDYFAPDEKPVIYLYPEKNTDIEVSLDYNGILTCTYPRNDNGRTVTAQPDGTLWDASGQEYNYLYWEGITATEYDFSQGFCVAGSETAAFLEDALADLGLNRREANFVQPEFFHN